MLGAVLVLATSARGATLTRGPYLQLLTTTSVTIVWNTDTPSACGLALRDPTGGIMTLTGPSGTVCAMPLRDLSTGASYGYTPLADGIPLDGETVFRTDDPRAPFSFLVLGDSGCGCLPQFALADRMQRTPHDFILSTGDMIYEDALAADYDPKFFGPYRALLKRAVFWPVLGNHDVRTANGAPWYDAFYTPANNPARSESYYSFDFGNAHVAVIDSNTATSPGSAQYRFLDGDLAASPARWKFVAFHHTIYSSGAHRSNTSIQRNLVPLFDRQRVDVVFMGHDHDYERTLPLRARVPAPGGTSYVTTGGGGKSITPVGRSKFTAYAEASFHFVRVAIDGDVLKLQMIREDGSVGDTVTLTKNGAVPDQPICGDDLVDQPTEQCDGRDAAACPAGCRADCRCMPACGDGVRNQPTEACDGNDATNCPALCRVDCSCGSADDFVTLPASADTYIASGAEASWDHGLAPVLATDAKPPTVAYLRFDLGDVTRPIQWATLTLHCTNSALDGGSIYPVPDSSWVEGDRLGTGIDSAGGPGLTWNDVDTNGDLRTDTLDTSPWVPDVHHLVGGPGPVTAGQSSAIDVTPAFQNGPGVYSLAIASLNQDGAVYASRESPDPTHRPALRLELAGSTETTSTSSSTSTRTTSSTSSSTSTTSSTTTNSSTSTTTTTSITAPPRDVDLEPAADTYVENGVQATWDHGASDHLDVDLDVFDIAYLTFDLRDQPGTVLSATLTLYCTSASPDGGTVYPVGDASWIEGSRTGRTTASAAGSGLKWTDVDTNADRSIDALDASSFVPDFTSPRATIGPVVVGQTASVKLTAALQRGPGLYSFAIRNGSRNGATYSSRNHPIAAQHPRLHLVVQ